MVSSGGLTLLTTLQPLHTRDVSGTAQARQHGRLRGKTSSSACRSGQNRTGQNGTRLGTDTRLKTQQITGQGILSLQKVRLTSTHGDNSTTNCQHKRERENNIKGKRTRGTGGNTQTNKERTRGTGDTQKNED